MKLSLSFVALATVAAGCTEPAMQPGVEPPSSGVAIVRTPDGIRELPYVDRGGRAIFDGDIDLGPVAKFRTPMYGGAVHEEMGRRWPDGLVRYRFAADLSAAQRSRIREQLQLLERVAPLDFVDIGTGSHAHYIEFRRRAASADENAYQPSTSSDVGMDPWFSQDIVFTIADLDGDGTIDDDVPLPRTVLHETLHALGLFHEQSRHDAGYWTDVDHNCIDMLAWGQFTERWESLDLGLYDFESVMHYSTGAECVGGEPARCNLYLDQDGDGDQELVLRDGEPVCRTITRADGGPRIKAAEGLSREDVATLWRMYAEKIEDGEAGDRAGQALAIGDFDDDGYDDVAVGVPFEDVNGAADAGAVLVFRGTSNRLVPWRMLDRGTLAGTGDHLGSALFAIDVDRDGVDDLMVGSPDDNVGAAIDAGSVDVYFGVDERDVGGLFGALQERRNYTQETVGGVSESGDRFGAAVAAVRMDLESNDAKAAWERLVVIGAPGDHNGTVRSGAVYLQLRKKDGSVSPVRRKLVEADVGEGGAFGATILVGDLDGGVSEIVIGSPQMSGRGAVHIYNLSSQGPGSALVQARRQRIMGGTAGAEFGAALAKGDVFGTFTFDELVVGAPGTGDGVGEVLVYQLQTNPFGTPVWGLADQVFVGDAVAGDRFGAALAIADLDPASTKDEIVVGVPGENGGAGAIALFSGAPGDVIYQRVFRHDDFAAQFEETEDGFGSALAIGNLDGIGDGLSSDQWGDDELEVPDVVVGIPGEAIDFPPSTLIPEGPAAAGGFAMLRGDGGGLDVARMYYQHSATRD